MTRKKTAKVKKPAKRRRGYKVCPQCSKHVGARTRICECGYEFEIRTPRRKSVSYENQLESLRTTMEKRLEEIATEQEELEAEQKTIKERLKKLEGLVS